EDPHSPGKGQKEWDEPVQGRRAPQRASRDREGASAGITRCRQAQGGAQARAKGRDAQDRGKGSRPAAGSAGWSGQDGLTRAEDPIEEMSRLGFHAFLSARANAWFLRLLAS